MLAESDIDSFVEDQVPVNTRKKTESDVKIFLQWLKEAAPEESRDLLDISPSELNTFLRSFYLTVKKKDGGAYEPDTIRGFQNSLDRYLAQKHYCASIIRSEEFKSSRDVLQAKRRALKKEGLGRKPNRSEHLTEEEEKVLWEKGVMGKTNPVALQNAVWWRNNFFGLRGRDEHHKMRWGDLSIETDVEGRRYVRYLERDTKTRKDPANERAITPRIYETPETPDTCPVLLLLEFTHRRPLEMVQQESPFYIQPNKFYQTSKSGVWYKAQRLGEHSLSKIMKQMAADAGLPGRKTNHSGRKTTVKRLREAEVDNVDIIQLTGHKNVQSLNSYSTVTEKKQRHMSDVLVKAEIYPDPAQPSSIISYEDEFSDDFDVDSAMKSLENYECDGRAINVVPNSNQESKEFNLTAQSALGFAVPLFQGANISGGVFNLTLNFNGKSF